MSRNNKTVVFEPEIESHPRELYAASEIATGASNFSEITVDHVRQYAEQGFLLIENAYLREEIERARVDLGRMLSSSDPDCEKIYFEGALRNVRPDLTGDSQPDTANSGEALALGSVSRHLPDLTAELRVKYVRKFMGFVNSHPPLAALAFKPELLALCARLIGNPIQFYQDMAMIKPPGGREKPWHQDHAYFDLALNTRVVGAWIALDDVDSGNGCMHVLPGGHRTGPRLHFHQRDWQICDTEMLGKLCCAIPMKAGGCLLFDAMLPHGTPTNYSDRHRWAVQFHYIEADAGTIRQEDRMAVFGSEGKNVSC